jgi:hypothetical protein
LPARLRRLFLSLRDFARSEEPAGCRTDYETEEQDYRYFHLMRSF